MGSGSVLLVEDDDDLRLTVAEILRDRGVEVAEASNGIEALSWMHDHPLPDAIVLDLMMPKMNGLQFRQEQLSDPALAAVPVVFITASTVGQSVLDATGASSVLRKPVTADQLLEAVRPFVDVGPS